MERTTVKDIARIAQCSPHTVRKYADKGHIKSNRDLNGWRIFPNPEQAATTIRKLLLGEESDSAEQAA